MSTYVNVHGKPLATSARDAVLIVEPTAYATMLRVRRLGRKRAEALWEIRRARADGKQRNGDRLIGDGATEESAWRNTWSRMLAEDVAKEGRP